MKSFFCAQVLAYRDTSLPVRHLQAVGRLKTWAKFPVHCPEPSGTVIYVVSEIPVTSLEGCVAWRNGGSRGRTWDL